MLIPPFYPNGGKGKNGKKQCALSHYPGAEINMDDGVQSKIQEEMERQGINKKKVDPKTDVLPDGFKRGKDGLILLDDEEKK